MTFQIIRQKIYSSLPKSLQKKSKNFYYNKFIFPLYNLKYKLNYNKWDFFDSISLETTSYCNLRCKFCPNSKYGRGLLKNKKLMDEKLFKKIINELAEINYRGHVLFHFYGEPLTDKRLPSLVEYTKKKLPRAKLQINTNGFLLTISLYKKLVDNGVKLFIITQYADSVPPNIKDLLDYLKTRPKKENKIKYRILGEDIGLSNRGGEINVKKNIDYERPICTYPNTAIPIDYNGNVILCCNDYHSSITFGNLKKEKLLDVWRKPHYKKLRDEMRKGIFKLPICKKCVGLE